MTNGHQFDTLVGVKLKNFWTGQPATIPEIIRYRKAAGYTLQEDVKRIWHKHLVWKVLRLIPREVKYWVVVQAAVKGSHTGSPDVTYSDMIRTLEKNEARQND